MIENQTQHPHQAITADKAYLLWVQTEALSSWLMEHYWHEIIDRIEARQCIDEWPPELDSKSTSTVP
jgi:hypothetical protein